MVIASIEREEELIRKGFRKAKNGFFVPNFKDKDVSALLPQIWVDKLKEKRFKPRQIQYIASVLTQNDLDVIKDSLGDALYIAIIDSMSSAKLTDFYERFRPDPVYDKMYHNQQTQWVFRSYDLCRKRVNHEPTNDEMRAEVDKFVGRRFRAYWRMRFPEKTERKTWGLVRRAGKNRVEDYSI